MLETAYSVEVACTVGAWGQCSGILLHLVVVFKLSLRAWCWDRDGGLIVQVLYLARLGSDPLWGRSAGTSFT